MPAMSGWDIAAAVKTRRPTLPVGVITGWGDLPETVAGPRAAVDFVIAKPINLDELADAIARARSPLVAAAASGHAGEVGGRHPGESAGAWGDLATPRAGRQARARAIMASRRRRCSAGLGERAADDPTVRNPAPSGGWGAERAESGASLRRQASHAGARRAAHRPRCRWPLPAALRRWATSRRNTEIGLLDGFASGELGRGTG